MASSEKSLSGLIGIYRSREFARFLIVGAVALAIHWTARLGLSIWLSFGPAVVAAYAIALAAGFELNRRFVFPPSGKERRRQILWYVGVNLAMFPVVYALAGFLSEAVFGRFFDQGAAEALGHGAAIAAPVFVNFAAHKLLTFRSAASPGE
jgi:putative flippase GtrA